jgi:hypothetical protein
VVYGLRHLTKDLDALMGQLRASLAADPLETVNARPDVLFGDGEPLFLNRN